MNPKEALEILKTASGLAALNRNDHIRIMEAVQTLEKFLEERK